MVFSFPFLTCLIHSSVNTASATNSTKLPRETTRCVAPIDQSLSAPRRSPPPNPLDSFLPLPSSYSATVPRRADLFFLYHFFLPDFLLLLPSLLLRSAAQLSGTQGDLSLPPPLTHTRECHCCAVIDWHIPFLFFARATLCLNSCALDPRWLLRPIPHCIGI